MNDDAIAAVLVSILGVAAAAIALALLWGALRERFWEAFNGEWP